MPTNQYRGHALAARPTDREPFHLTANAEARGRCRIRQRFTAVADCLQGGRPEPRWMFDDAIREDAEQRQNVGFITKDVRDLRRVLEAARREGPVSLRDARLAARAYFDAKLEETLAGFEAVTVDTSSLSEEIVGIAREASDIPPVLVEFQQHPTPGTWARVKKEIDELLERVPAFVHLGKAQHEAPHRRPAA